MYCGFLNYPSLGKCQSLERDKHISFYKFPSVRQSQISMQIIAVQEMASKQFYFKSYFFIFNNEKLDEKIIFFLKR